MSKRKSNYKKKGNIIKDLTRKILQLLNQDGNWRLRVVGGDYSLADGSSMRAQLFYDSNNTAYYTDPASTSNLLGLTVVNTITGSITGNAGGSSASCTGNAASASSLANFTNQSGARYTTDFNSIVTTGFLQLNSVSRPL